MLSPVLSAQARFGNFHSSWTLKPAPRTCLWPSHPCPPSPSQQPSEGPATVAKSSSPCAQGHPARPEPKTMVQAAYLQQPGGQHRTQKRGN